MEWINIAHSNSVLHQDQVVDLIQQKIKALNQLESDLTVINRSKLLNNYCILK